jgi:hypothetical protein
MIRKNKFSLSNIPLQTFHYPWRNWEAKGLKSHLLTCHLSWKMWSLRLMLMSKNCFYKRKSNAYNLTAHCCSNVKAHCAVWHEMISGRTANHTACAMLKILNSLLGDIPSVKHIVPWTDSCVPRNKTQVVNLALMNFMNNIPLILKQVTVTFKRWMQSRAKLKTFCRNRSI